MTTISGIRHSNLLALIDQAGRVRQFAERIDRSYSQVSQLKNRSKHSTTGMPREIGDGMARHIERQLALPVGWMDQMHPPASAAPSVTALVLNEPSAPFAVLPSIWPFAHIAPARYADLSLADRDRVEGFALALLETNSRAKHHSNGGGR